MERELEVKLLLDVIVGLMQQYMPHDENHYHHQCMSAGEHAADALIHYGLADDNGYSIVLDEEKVECLRECVVGIHFPERTSPL